MAVLLVFGDSGTVRADMMTVSISRASFRGCAACLRRFWRPAACCHQCVAVIRCFAASFWLPVFGVRYIEQVYLHNSMILELSTASLRSVCSSKHEAGQRSFWFEIRISLGLYKLFLLVRFNRKSPRSSESCNKA